MGETLVGGSRQLGMLTPVSVSGGTNNPIDFEPHGDRLYRLVDSTSPRFVTIPAAPGQRRVCHPTPNAASPGTGAERCFGA